MHHGGFIYELALGQADVEFARVEEGPACHSVSGEIVWQ
jgi:hypothetical protein